MNEKLNIQQLVDTLAQKHSMNRQEAERFVKEFFTLIEQGLEKDKYVKIKGFGTFKLIEVEARESVNVNTGERFEIQGHTKVSFTPETGLKDLINKPFEQFETVTLNEETVLEDTPIENNTPEETVQEETTPVPEEVAPMPEEEVIPTEEVAPAPEPTVIPENPEKLPLTPEEKEQRTTMKYFIGIVVFIVLLCGIAIAFMYNPNLYDYILPQKEVKEVTRQLPVDTAAVAAANSSDTILRTDKVIAEADKAIVQADEAITQADKTITQADKTAQPSPTPDVAPAPAGKPLRAPAVLTDEIINASYRADSTSYVIAGTLATHKIAAGETLTRIALKYYGTKAPWPYIVKHNPTAIKNANNVPLGTVIKIPELIKK
jgi:nucleoid DNA-binding protein/LysM repeat protein